MDPPQHAERLVELRRVEPREHLVEHEQRAGSLASARPAPASGARAGSPRAGARQLRGEPDHVEVLGAEAGPVQPFLRREQEARATLSRTVIESNGFGIWCVRATPRWSGRGRLAIDPAPFEPHHPADGAWTPASTEIRRRLPDPGRRRAPTTHPARPSARRRPARARRSDLWTSHDLEGARSSRRSISHRRGRAARSSMLRRRPRLPPTSSTRVAARTGADQSSRCPSRRTRRRASSDERHARENGAPGSSRSRA